MECKFHLILLLLTYSVIDFVNLSSYFKADAKILPHSDGLFCEYDKLISKDYTGSAWPDGIVKYNLHYSLSQSDKQETFKAFEMIQSETCIRFIEKSPQDKDFVSIKRDTKRKKDFCGTANLCRIGGKQIAKFGESCRSSKVIAHLLLHTLCMIHEHDRKDRDKYVKLSGHLSKVQRDIMNKTQRMYDFRSIMHYKCNANLQNRFVLKQERACGGYQLSILDIEVLNAFYNCSGCSHGYRFKSVEQLNEKDKLALMDYGYDISNNFLYICRANHNQELVVGSYEANSGTCSIVKFGKEYLYKEGAEVLLIPSLANNPSEDVISNITIVVYPKNGRYFEKEDFINFTFLKFGRSSIGIPEYGAVTSFQEDGWDVKKIGKVRLDSKATAYFAKGGKEIKLQEYGIIACHDKFQKSNTNKLK